MIRKAFISSALSALMWVAASLASAATVPAGATLVAQTLETISSVDPVGTRFPAQLKSNLMIEGNVVLPAGTKLSGRVVTSRRLHSSTQRLTVDITEATVRGHAVPIKTTGAVLVENNRFKTRNDVSVSRAGYHVPAGRTLVFQLAQPIKL